jgi:hypothetical protein
MSTLRQAMKDCKRDITPIIADSFIDEFSNCNDESSVTTLINSILDDESQLRVIAERLRSLVRSGSQRINSIFLKYPQQSLFVFLTERINSVRISGHEIAKGLFPELSPQFSLSQNNETSLRSLLSQSFHFIKAIPNPTCGSSIPGEERIKNRYRFVEILKFIKWMIKILNCDDSETFLLILDLFTLFTEIQQHWSDYNVLKSIGLLTRFPPLLLQPHFVTVFNRSFRFAINDFYGSDPGLIFGKFQRYFHFATLQDIHTILDHQLYDRIQSTAKSTVFELFRKELQRFPDDPICQSFQQKPYSPPKITAPASPPPSSPPTSRRPRPPPNNNQNRSTSHSLTRQKIESDLTTIAQGFRPEYKGAHAIQSFILAFELGASLFSDPKIQTRLDPFDESFITPAIQNFSKIPCNPQVRNSCRNFFCALCQFAGNEILPILRRIIVDKYGQTRRQNGTHIIFVLFALIAEFGGDVEAVVEEMVDLVKDLGNWDSIEVLWELVNEGNGKTDWFSMLFVRLAGVYRFGNGKKDLEFCKLGAMEMREEEIRDWIDKQFGQGHNPNRQNIVDAMMERFKKEKVE